LPFEHKVPENTIPISRKNVSTKVNIFHLVLVAHVAHAAYNISRLEKNVCVQKYSFRNYVNPSRKLGTHQA
jgi:hypothetical protein